MPARNATWRAEQRGWLPCGRGFAPWIRRSPFLWCVDPKTGTKLWTLSEIHDSSIELYSSLGVTPAGHLLVYREQHQFESKRFDPIYADLLDSDNTDRLQFPGSGLHGYTGSPTALVARLVGEIESRKLELDWVTASRYYLCLLNPLSGQEIQAAELTPAQVSFGYFPGWTLAAGGTFQVASWGNASAFHWELVTLDGTPDDPAIEFNFTAGGTVVTYEEGHEGDPAYAHDTPVPLDYTVLTDFIDITPYGGRSYFYAAIDTEDESRFSAVPTPSSVEASAAILGVTFRDSATLYGTAKPKVPYSLAPEPAISLDVCIGPRYFYVLESVIHKPDHLGPFGSTEQADNSLPLANQPSKYHVRAYNNQSLELAWDREIPISVDVTANTSALFAGYLGVALTVLVQADATTTHRVEINGQTGAIIADTTLHAPIDLLTVPLLAASSDLFLVTPTQVQIYESTLN